MVIQEGSGGGYKDRKSFPPGHSQRLELTDNQANNNSQFSTNVSFEGIQRLPSCNFIPFPIAPTRWLLLAPERNKSHHELFCTPIFSTVYAKQTIVKDSVRTNETFNYPAQTAPERRAQGQRSAMDEGSGTFSCPNPLPFPVPSVAWPETVVGCRQELEDAGKCGITLARARRRASKWPNLDKPTVVLM